jgi:hypothetical protein
MLRHEPSPRLKNRSFVADEAKLLNDFGKVFIRFRSGHPQAVGIQRPGRDRPEFVQNLGHEAKLVVLLAQS